MPEAMLVVRRAKDLSQPDNYPDHSSAVQQRRLWEDAPLLHDEERLLHRRERLCIARQLLKAEPQAYRSRYRIENLFGRIKAHELERLLPWA